ncbi:MAG: hypothetical protein JNK02_04065 [Planctomycetes bacterium]|nr:hypothetical protein [Planctomycetota bacterium]
MQFSLSIPLAAIAAGSFGILALDRGGAPPTAQTPTPSSALRAQRTALVGDVRVLEARYAAWSAANPRTGDVQLPLAWSRALSTERTPARGRFAFDAGSGSIEVELEAMPQGAHYEAWVVDDAAGTSAAPDASDTSVRLGELVARDGRASLRVEAAALGLEGFDLDLVVVTRSGATPVESVLLAGMPGLFQRLASRAAETVGEPPSGVVLRSRVDEETDENTDDNSYLGGMPDDSAGDDGSSDPAGGPLPDLIEAGEALFFHETFYGNGRTCGTCHPAENNFTIEPAFIATLPPDDPLFVAEFVPELNFDLNGGLRFENPILMRQFGLIVENLDGFDDLRYRFTMRSVSHTLGMTQSITSPDGPGVVPVERTGWSGDGAPGQGTLREFALGAVRQHFTRTMGRVPGADFVFPTNAELDALEAFQLSLGRQEELDLATLSLRDPDADEGRVRFGDLSCDRCHEHAGANRGGANFNFATGVEAFARNNPDGTGELRPPDGGLGTNPAGGHDTIEESPEPDDPSVMSFGNKTFNTVSLVEFADTVPGFHNNITNMGALGDTVEGAVSFYRSAEFQNSPDGFVIPFQGNDIENIGKFLRVINALENRRSADAYGERAANLIAGGGFDPAAVERVLFLAQAECTDGMEVLSQVGLHLQDAVPHFEKAWWFFEFAKSGPDADRLQNIQTARDLLEGARVSMQN